MSEQSHDVPNVEDRGWEITRRGSVTEKAVEWQAFGWTVWIRLADTPRDAPDEWWIGVESSTGHGSAGPELIPGTGMHGTYGAALREALRIMEAIADGEHDPREMAV